MGSCTHLGGWAHRGGPGRVWFGPHTGDGVRGPCTVPGGRLPGAFAPPLPPPGARSPPGSQLPPIAQPRLGRLGPSTLRHTPRAPLGNVLPRCTQGSQKSSFSVAIAWHAGCRAPFRQRVWVHEGGGFPFAERTMASVTRKAPTCPPVPWPGVPAPAPGVLSAAWTACA